jgi:hypothetical protein
MADNSSLNYKMQANIKIEFQDNGTEKTFYNLLGFLSDEGLKLNLTNKYENSLDLAGSIFGVARQLMAGINVLTDISGDIGKKIGDALNVKTDWSHTSIRGYAATGSNKAFTTALNVLFPELKTDAIEGANIMLNAPYYWQGTDPIQFDVALYQIADSETDIINSYQKILEALSPSFGNYSLGGTEEGSGRGQSTRILGIGQGPCLAFVHYFPVDGKWNADESGTGTIVYGPCLCTSVSMEVKPPFTHKYAPIIGAYRFQFLTTRILDRTKIWNIFGPAGKELHDKEEKNKTPEK